MFQPHGNLYQSEEITRLHAAVTEPLSHNRDLNAASPSESRYVN